MCVEPKPKPTVLESGSGYYYLLIAIGEIVAWGRIIVSGLLECCIVQAQVEIRWQMEEDMGDTRKVCCREGK